MYSHSLSGAAPTFATGPSPPAPAPPPAPPPLPSSTCDCLPPVPSQREMASAPPPSSSAAASAASAVGPCSCCCVCLASLDPYPAQPANPSGLLHYCRVCNTQLNSCKQVNIHVGGKKHGKRLNLLKFSMGHTGAGIASAVLNKSATSSDSNAPQNGGAHLLSTFAAQCVISPPQSADEIQQQQQQHYQQQQLQYQHQQQSQQSASNDYYYPSGCYYPPPYPIYAPAPSFLSPPPSVAGYSGMGYPPTFGAPAQYFYPLSTLPEQPQQHQQSHHLMSPSLTSGIGGSVETSSLISAASYSSYSQRTSRPPPEHVFAGGRTSASMAHCYLALAGASASAEEAALAAANGGVVAQSSYKASLCLKHAHAHHHANTEMGNGNSSSGSDPSSGVSPSASKASTAKASAEVRSSSSSCEGKACAVGGAGDICCEVCQVSVNSSQQLQAHLTGHKHRVRCLRRGINPSTALLTPYSSSGPSRSPSECSYSHLPSAGGESRADDNKTSLLGFPRAGCDVRHVEVRTSLMGNPPAGLARLRRPAPPAGVVAWTTATPKVRTRRVKSGDNVLISSGFHTKVMHTHPVKSIASPKTREKIITDDAKQTRKLLAAADEKWLLDGDSDETESAADKLVHSSPMLDKFLQTLEPHQFFDSEECNAEAEKPIESRER